VRGAHQEAADSCGVGVALLLAEPALVPGADQVGGGADQLGCPLQVRVGAHRSGRHMHRGCGERVVGSGLAAQGVDQPVGGVLERRPAAGQGGRGGGVCGRGASVQPVQFVGGQLDQLPGGGRAGHAGAGSIGCD